MKVKLSQRYVEKVVAQLNEILDKNYIYGKEYNKQVIKQLIIENLSKNAACELIEEIEQTSIAEFRD